MADTGIFCTGTEVTRKAGAKAASAAVAEAFLNDFIAQAESYINAVCNYNFSAAYVGLTAAKKLLLKEAASNIAAIYVINYDMSGYTSRTESITMLNVLWDRAQLCLNLLKEGAVNEYLLAA